MRIYHGTQYHKSIRENGFDITKSYAQRNDKLGAGEAVYFSYDYDIASDYSTANANESFHPCVIDELEQSDPVAGYLLRQLYENGTEVAWEALENHYEEQGGWAFLREYYNDKKYDLNDVQSIAEYIRGSKVLEENTSDDTFAILMGGSSAGMPHAIREDAALMGIKTIPSVYGEVIVSKLKSTIKIKNIGNTKNAPEEAIVARKEGYDAIEFVNDYSVEREVELAVFNTSQIEVLNLIQQSVSLDKISIRDINIVMQAIVSGKNTLSEVLKEAFHPGFIRFNLKDSEDSLKTILGLMVGLKLIKYNKEEIISLINLQDLEKQIKKSKLAIADSLIKEINERKFKEGMKNRKINSYNHPQ